jgi:TonB family protein
VRRIATATLLLAASTLVLGQTADPPALEEVFRQFPPDPHALDFAQHALPPSISGIASNFGGIAGGPVYMVGGGVTAPRPLKAPDPHYSKEGVKKKIQGTVVLWVVIGVDGVPKDIRVARTLGYGFDEEAIKAMRQWRFQPATKDGQPVAVQINVEMHFRMRW